MIDKQLASISDEQLAATPEPAAAAPAAPAAPAALAGRPAAPRSAPGAAAAPAMVPPPGAVAPRGWRAHLALNGKLLLSLAAAVGIVFWPYGYRCGSDLAVYFGAVTGVTALGLWAARSTWFHRAGKRHVLALLVVGWGLGLAAWQVLPRAGYALPDSSPEGRTTAWVCR